jgi:hypothetical protein
MTSFINLPNYRVETDGVTRGADNLKVVRKADGAFFPLEGHACRAPLELLWMYVHGDKDLNDHAQGIIDQVIEHCEASGTLWLSPKLRPALT